MSYPADWYPDPAGDPSLLRWWDGIQWTEHTHPMPQQQQPVVAAQVEAEPATHAPADPEPVVDHISMEQADEDMTVARPAQAPAMAPVAQPATQHAGAPAARSVDAVAGIRSDLLSGDYAEVDANARVVLQNSRMLKVRLGEAVLARQGSMVAFQGQVDFNHEGSGGVGKLLKKTASGEGVSLMRCSGQGEVFFASEADEIHILHLEGSALSVNGRNILAFEPTLEYDIQRVQGAGVLSGGLFNTRMSGHGWVAITTKGTPVVLHTNQPTFGDPDAVVAWSANLQTSLNKTVKSKALVGLGSGEAYQLAFQGEGIVIVQPAEYGRPAGS
jgi:uncharacterized protein (AIM24 family)